MPPGDPHETLDHSIVQYSDEWTDEDLRDLSRDTWKRIENDPEYAYDDSTE